MPNVRRLRLHQVARELKVGQTTIVEYLEKKGIKVENAPSTLIEPHVYEVLDKEFGANKAETVNIRLRSLFAALEERDEAAEEKAAPKAEA